MAATNTREAICEYLRKYHVGRCNAVHTRELQCRFPKHQRSLRYHISQLRIDGYPICSDENGYWYAEHQFEINRTVRRFNQCITHMSVVRNGLLDSKIIEEGNLHIELRVIMKPPKGGRTIGQ